MSYDIFLSYRRKDADGHSNVGTARTFKYEFENHQYEVFFDYKDCTDEYFQEIILPAIRTCRYFVLVLTRGCLERCKDEDDWLRREIKEAIKYRRKIIPITPDGEFGAWPKSIPESIKDLDGLQITTIHTDSIFEENMAQLIRNRMNPPQRRKAEGMENFPKLKVKSNLDCVMYVDEEERANISANKLEKIPLKAGEYMLKFESVENVADYLEEEYTMPAEDRLKKVDLFQIKQDRELREQDERERKEREIQEKERKECEEKARKERESLERERKERMARGEMEVEGVKFKMVYVEGGTFMMGATEEQGGDASYIEKPVHKVTLDDFYIGETVVTQGLWKSVVGKNPSYFDGNDNLPVVNVSWVDAQEFTKELSHITGRSFRLPTEAEWEYAARGGNRSKGYKYSGSNFIEKVAWYDENSKSKTHPVKEKKPNELGLYDMSGNVGEWCQDWYGEYGIDTQESPQGSALGFYKVYRGGSWGHSAKNCRVSCRTYRSSMDCDFLLGFRLVMNP